MLSSEDLRSTLYRIDGKGYRAYRDISGTYDMGEFTLRVDHVQGDPFAAPSRVAVRLSQDTAGFPRETFFNHSREIGLRDLLTRYFSGACRRLSGSARGTGKSGIIDIDRPGQEVLERTSVVVNEDYLEARFVMGLPAFGRRIAGRQAERMFFDELPEVVDSSLINRNLDEREVLDHVKCVEDADMMRDLLPEMGLVSFIANGSVLPRRSGIDPRPMVGERVVRFRSPPELEVTMETPNRGKIKGMGIRKGITLIVGGGYHGKSTLLSAIELGIYDHVLGDGREFVVTDPDAFKIRAEDQRRVESVDISPFIDNLPLGQDTRSFSTQDASGSTSQAANIIEALEAGATTLLIDEDTSATNFMIRDHRMQELVAKAKEPITPFIDRVRQLYGEHDVSTVLVIGGSGDYFDVADRVICMEEYLPMDRTDRAKDIAHRFKAVRTPEGAGSFGDITCRCPLPGSFDPSRGKREVKIAAKGLRNIAFGRENIDLSHVEQLVDISQTRAIGDAIHRCTRYMDGKKTLGQVMDSFYSEMDHGLESLSSRPVGDYAQFRRLELACAINRLRTVRMDQRR